MAVLVRLRSVETLAEIMGSSLPSGSVSVKGDVSGTVRAPGSEVWGAKLGAMLVGGMSEVEWMNGKMNGVGLRTPECFAEMEADE